MYPPVCAMPPPGFLISDKSGLAEAIKNFATNPANTAEVGDVGVSYSLKAISPDVIHKTDMGAVKLDLKDQAGIENAWDTIVENIKNKKPDAKLEGMLLQIMSCGKETIIGMKKDATFGPTLLFGLGGIFTEALKDTTLRVAPVSKEMAMEMIREIRGINILNGSRGEKPVDFDKLADIIVKISKLAVENPAIKEIDLNPVMTRPDGVDIVDVRVMI